MRESQYQSKIIKGFESIGGWCVNGLMTKKGEVDLHGGYPIDNQLHYIAIEVKTEKAYNYMMQGIEIVDGRYKIVDFKKLKDQEPMQILKLNKIRDRGGLALLAYSFEQVKEYIDDVRRT
jgi:hypothetical protein